MSKKARTAITPTRDDDFPVWYQAVIKAADLAENSPVRGCMTIKPYGYALWENMQRTFDDMIKLLGVQNAYFPLLIPLEFMNKEAKHVEGFAMESAVVTHHRLEADPDNPGSLRAAPSSKLEEPYIIRPTSETIIGEAMSRWIQSYRDLPMKLNQWCNVMRWEMRTRMFLRTSEFLWQEGHHAFENEAQAREDTYRMLDAYAEFVEDSLAIPVIKGEKTEDERFPGADMTITIESMMQDGKALQSATSHYLGTNFAQACDITFQGRDGNEHHVHTTSWGLSTRMIGAIIMVHADDDGMVMPPRVAPQQVGIIPVIKDNQDRGRLMAYVHDVSEQLQTKGIRVFVDESEARTPDKMWAMIKKGVPLRVEVGMRELEDGVLTHVRRDLGRESKATSSVQEFIEILPDILDDIHHEMYNRAKSFMDARIVEASDLKTLETLFKEGHVGFVRVPTDLTQDTDYARITKEYSLTSRCLPFMDKGEIVLVGKAY